MNNALSPAPRIIQTNPAIGERGLIHVYDGNPSRESPYVVGIHGGGWRSGDQTSYHGGALRPLVKALGFSLVLATYRLAPEFRFPCAYDDLVHLLAWLRDNGAEQGLDPSRCLFLGGSAGAHLVMLLATRAVKENRPMPRIRGVVNYCGVMDLSAQYAVDVARGSTMVRDFLGAEPESNPALYRDASPICHVHDRMPPVWMAHGSADRTVPVSQSRDMVRAMIATGHDPVYLEARGLEHTMGEIDLDGKHLEPGRLLFQDDVSRFIHRTLNQK